MVEVEDQQSARAITAGAQLYGVRRHKHAASVLLTMVANPGSSFSAAARGHSAALEQYYRHGRAAEVPFNALLKAGSAVTAAESQRHEEQNDIYLIGDMTPLSYRHAAAGQLGPMQHVRNSINRGWLVHTALAIDAGSEETLRPVEQLWW